MGPLFVILVWLVISVPLGLICGVVFSYTAIPLYYKIRLIPVQKRSLIGRNKFAAIGISWCFFVVLIIGLNVVGMFAMLYNSTDYWKSSGLTDYNRVPLEHPYDLTCSNSYENGQINDWNRNRCLVGGITRYLKSGSIIIGEKSRPNKSWFIFDCNNGIESEFFNYDKFIIAIRNIGFESEPELMSIEDNYFTYWANPYYPDDSLE